MRQTPSRRLLLSCTMIFKFSGLGQWLCHCHGSLGFLTRPAGPARVSRLGCAGLARPGIGWHKHVIPNLKTFRVKFPGPQASNSATARCCCCASAHSGCRQPQGRDLAAFQLNSLGVSRTVTVGPSLRRSAVTVSRRGPGSPAPAASGLCLHSLCPRVADRDRDFGQPSRIHCPARGTGPGRKRLPRITFKMPSFTGALVA
jgi:hypothetical protein